METSWKKQIDGYTTETTRGQVWVYRNITQYGAEMWFARFSKVSNDYGWGDTRDEALRGLMASAEVTAEELNV